jgi:hypothetical protein
MTVSKKKMSMIQVAVTMLLFGFCVGYVMSHIYNQNVSDSSMAAHVHKPFDISEYENKPTVEMSLTKDAKSGWNAQLSTTNFKFTPENASSNHVDGQGHAHLFIDGKKITRIYGPDFYIAELEEGSHTIMVGLSTNDHQDYFDGDEPIAASVLVTEDGVESHTHEGDEDHMH